jgi:hypothetical protein
MATPAQILANRQNAEKSAGPVTAEGRARVSQNATSFALFSVANFVRPEERDIFNEFESGYLAELSPATSLEQTLAREIIHAAWRLRRCANLEVAPPENLTDEELERLQISIDRARAAAQRTFHRSLKELRRLQAEHLHPAEVAIRQAMAMDALLKQDLENRQRRMAENAANDSAKQTQFHPVKAGLVPRSALCPGKSGQNDERRATGQASSPDCSVPGNASGQRCSGKNAPPVLSSPAA